MAFNIKEAVKYKCRKAFEIISANNPYFTYQTYKDELKIEIEEWMVKVKPRVNLSKITLENDMKVGFDSSINFADLTQSQINAMYLHFIETLNYFNEADPPTKDVPENLHPTMFINDSFKLFEYILENHITQKSGRINDISFYYRKMYKDKLIIQKPFAFQDWFSENYSEVIGKIQTLESVSNTDRLQHYSTSLNWYKTVKQ